MLYRTYAEFCGCDGMADARFNGIQGTPRGLKLKKGNKGRLGVRVSRGLGGRILGSRDCTRKRTPRGQNPLRDRSGSNP